MEVRRCTNLSLRCRRDAGKRDNTQHFFLSCQKCTNWPQMKVIIIGKERFCCRPSADVGNHPFGMRRCTLTTYREALLPERRARLLALLRESTDAFRQLKFDANIPTSLHLTTCRCRITSAAFAESARDIGTKRIALIACRFAVHWVSRNRLPRKRFDLLSTRRFVRPRDYV